MDSKNTNKHYWLYVLELEDDCFYVGVTSKTPEARFKQHQNDFLAAEWTKLHKPITIMDTHDLGITTYQKAEVYENKVVRKYIQRYGIERVRGGDISKSGRHIIVFGYAFEKEDLVNLLSVLFMMFVIIYLALELYLQQLSS